MRRENNCYSLLLLKAYTIRIEVELNRHLQNTFVEKKNQVFYFSNLFPFYCFFYENE